MSQIKTEFKGMDIHYSENEDVWTCYDMGFSAPTLSAIKAKISAFEASARRLDDVPVFYLEHNGHRAGRRFATSITDDKASVWTRGDERRGAKKREKVRLGSVILDTPENVKAIAAYQDLAKIAATAKAAADEARAALPWATADALGLPGESGVA